MAGLPYLVKHKTGYLCNSMFHNTNPALECLYSVMATVSKYSEPHFTFMLPCVPTDLVIKRNTAPHLPISTNKNMQCPSLD